ncbi:ABC transporter substrate-binding protein [Acidobacteriota bacterium]
MKKKVWIVTVAVVIVAVFLYLVFINKKHDTATITIGAILPLTGGSAQWGIPPRNGAELAVEEINAKGGITGKNIIFIVEDTRAEPKEGVSAFNKIISGGKVKIVLGAVASSVTLAVAPIAEHNHIILISPGSSNPKITDAGDFIFRTFPTDTLRGKVFAEYLFNVRSIKNVDIIYINNEGGVGNRDSFKTSFIKLGGEVVLEEGYEQNALDLRSQITKIKGSTAEAVVVVSYPQDTILFLKQAREIDIGKPLYFQTEAVEDANVLREAGNAAEGVTYILPAPAQGTASSRFADSYEEKYGIKPELFAAEAYDIINLIANAVETNTDSSFSAELVRDYLYNVRDYAGASGTISFDQNGDVVKPMAIKRIENGEPKIVEVR